MLQVREASGSRDTSSAPAKARKATAKGGRSGAPNAAKLARVRAVSERARDTAQHTNHQRDPQRCVDNTGIQYRGTDRGSYTQDQQSTL
ncbi:hypothetical protein KL933_004953 [Ogataea haglerorum]|uniref:Uncharacterized protein n=1 Tax=Ogataea haglerorum TaxID=1937702 RepID=A0AAN6D155_9ASCO|nr:hypothetical protein KL915_004030 [Ogataea haglerorum]KAG7713422.1 hypothetical protein KL913_005043 [Ogataea haglerorum]KAG7713918.1 hypothetical protein KL949_005081 [Ogataea haglerorum]KAG7724202.1 hypothetical protein KL933_004953 [Ogataea haglerorum]KAG7805151.1 hypothetical protein KL924_005112 [Ogataea haglerorum]